jgi:hypothetical protein
MTYDKTKSIENRNVPKSLSPKNATIK